MNAGKSLVSTVHEIAISAEFAVATESAKKSDTNSLADGPTLYTSTESIDTSDYFVAWNTRPSNRKQPIYRGRIRMTDTACLDANADLIGTWIRKWLSYFDELSWS